MRNTIVVKNITLRMVLANREVSDILVNQAELNRENANSIAKLICQKIDERIRSSENPKDELVEMLAK
jgi:hypothetical protein